MLDEPNDEQKRGFTGYWIPVEIVNDPDLRPTDKLLIAEIYALQKSDPRGCRAGNEHLARHVGMTAGSVANAISRLRRMGYIENIRFDGRVRWIRARLVRLKQSSSDDEGRVHQAMNRKRSGNTNKNTDAEGSLRSLRPDLETVIAHALTKGISAEQAKDFWLYWESMGWKRRGQPIIKWKLALESWKRKDRQIQAEKKRLSAFEIQKRVTAINDAINKLWKDNRRFKKGTTELEVPPEIKAEIATLRARRDDLKKQLTK